MSRSKSLLGMFFICPAICFLSAISNLRKGNYMAAKIVPYIMGLFAYLFPPYSDFARNLNLVYDFRDESLANLWLVTADTVVPTIEYYFLKFDIPIEIFRFLYTFFVYKLFTNIFLDLQARFNLDKVRSFNVWVVLFMMISFFTYIINLRTLFVDYTLLYCIYEYYFKGRDKYRYYSLLLCFVHFAYFPIIGVFFLSKYINLHLPTRVAYIFIFLILISSIFSGSDTMMNILSSINFGDVINRKIEIYTTGEWSADGEAMQQMKTVNYMIYKSLASISIYYLYFLYVRTKVSHNLNRYINLLFVTIMFTMPIGSLFGRYLTFFVSALELLMVYAYCTNKISNKQIKIFIWLCLLETLLNVYAHWNCLVNGNVCFLFLPLPLALLQVYDFEDWCRVHLANDFNKIINLSEFSR